MLQKPPGGRRLVRDLLHEPCRCVPDERFVEFDDGRRDRFPIVVAGARDDLGGHPAAEKLDPLCRAKKYDFLVPVPARRPSAAEQSAAARESTAAPNSASSIGLSRGSDSHAEQGESR